MSLSKKRAPNVQSEQRAFQQIYDDMNELIDSINRHQYENAPETQGKKGDIRVIDDLTTKQKKLEIRTKDGWYSPDANAVSINGKEIVSGSPNDDDVLKFDSSSNSFKFEADGGGGGGSGDIEGVTAGSGLSGGGTTGTVTLNHDDTSSESSVNNSGQNFIQDITLDTYGHITGITSAEASGGGVVTSGTATPSSVSDKTPNSGDMYIQYTDSAGNGVIDSAIGYNENPPIIFIRDSDERLLEIKPHSSTSGYLKMSEKYDTATAIGNPRCNSQKFVTSSGGTTEPSSYQLVGTTTTVYARVTYADVTGDIDNGMPRMEFKNNWGGNSSAYADLDGTNKLYTTVSFTAGVSGTGGSRDSHTYCDYAPNTATEDDGSGSNQVPVDDAVASKKIYWRNNKVYGSRHAGDTWAEALSGTGASTCGGGSDPCSVEIETLSSNSNYNNIGSVSVTNRLGDQVFFAIPNGTANITSIKTSGNSVEQISTFTTTTATYTNSTNYAETYKIWYTTNPQAESTTTWEVS